MIASDHQLFEAMAARNTGALATIYDRHSRLLYGTILGLVRDTDDAEDLLQEVMLQIWNNAGSYRPELGSPRGWMVCIARNRAINLLRSRRHRQRMAESPLPDEDTGAAIPESMLEESTWLIVTRDEETRILCNAMSMLPAEQRELIDLAFLEGYSHSEIAEKTSIPLGTVKTRIRNGLLTLRSQLQDIGAERAQK